MVETGPKSRAKQTIQQDYRGRGATLSNKPSGFVENAQSLHRLHQRLRGSTIPSRVGWKWAVCFDAPRPATLANMSTARGAGHAEFCVRAARLYLYRVGCGIGVSFGNEPLMRAGQFEIPHLVTMPFSIMNFSTHT